MPPGRLKFLTRRPFVFPGQWPERVAQRDKPQLGFIPIVGSYRKISTENTVATISTASTVAVMRMNSLRRLSL